MSGLKEYTIKINGIEQGIQSTAKLEDALLAVEAATERVNKANEGGARSSTTKRQAMTEEERAAKKLEDTQRKLEQANSAANRAQIEANIALRERTRELNREITVSRFAEGSMKQMGMTLTDLRNEYEALSGAQRADMEVGGQLLSQIQALDAEYKSLRESTGNFRDSVGNYGRALDGIGKLTGGLNQARDASLGLAQNLLGSERTMLLFGTTAGQTSETMQNVQNAILLATAAQTVYNTMIKEGIVADGAALAIKGIKIVQLRAEAAAQALATRGTIAASIAQAAFNIVASANPYVLLALALVGVAAALYSFASRTDEASASQERLNAYQAAHIDMLDAEAEKLRTVGDLRVKELQRSLELLNASGAKTAEIRAAEDRLARERLANNARLRGFYGNELADLEENRKKVEQLTEVLRQLNNAKLQGSTSVSIDVDLDGNVETVKVDAAIETVQNRVDNLNRSVKIAMDLDAERSEIEHQVAVANATRAKADRDAAIARAKERADIERQAIRDSEDARIRLTRNSYERQVREIVQLHDRQIEDLKRRLKEEKNLTAQARKEINELIELSDMERYQKLEALDRERTASELQTLRESEDVKTALIIGELDRRNAEIRISYDRQIQDLQYRLDNELDLTKAQQEAITEMMTNAAVLRDRELEALQAENLKRSADLQLKTVDASLKQVRDRITDLTARDTPDSLINVEKTKRNMADVYNALGDYVNGLKQYKDASMAAFDEQTAGMDQNSIEYREAVQAQATALEDVNVKIAAALREQEDLVRKSAKVQTQYWQELFTKISNYAAVAAETITTVADTFSTGLEFAVEDLNTQLDQIDERLNKATEQREKAVEHTEALEERLRHASGGTAEALKRQLQDSMHARQEAERQEVQLQREKEKREAEIQKKEKQIRRNDLIAGMAQAVANTAQGVTKALSLIWPLNLIVAGIVGAAGTAQVGIMGRQLTKLAKGGKIIGPSHENGGVNINVQGKPSYEAQGGEFMVADKPYAANAPLVHMINEAQGRVALSDIAGLYTPDDRVAQVVESQTDQRLLDALDDIDFQPVVAVTDINNVNARMVAVQDLSDFS